MASSILFLTFAMKEIHMDRVANIATSKGAGGVKIAIKMMICKCLGQVRVKIAIKMMTRKRTGAGEGCN